MPMIDWFRAEGSKWLRPGAVAIAIVVSLYLAARPTRILRFVEAQKTASASPADSRHAGAAESLTADQGDSMTDRLQMASMAEPASPPQDNSYDRKLVRTASLDLVVEHPVEAAEKIRALAERLGGYLETSQVSGTQDAPTASLTIHVPAVRLTEAQAEIRKLAPRVEDERSDAQDVTRQYVDQDAQLRILRAEEEQYLSILKRATTVHDTLEVSAKLNEVRGQIEQQQSEFNVLSKQIESAALTVTLRAESDAQVFGLRWRPLYELKLAARQGLDGLGTYASAMAAILFILPAVALWMATIVIALAVLFRILRWCRRIFFRTSKEAARH